MRDLESVAYDLDLQESQRFLTSKAYGNLLDVLASLPEEIYDFVIQKIEFHSSCNQLISKSEIKKPKIVILTSNASKFTVAHEIAHAYLNHHFNYSNPKNPLKQEDEADAQA